jgi:predicted HTH transcriptional regulator
MDLKELLKQPEGKTLEFKRDISSPDGILRTIAAFANTAGGNLLIGVEDGTRRVTGIKDPLDVEARLTNLVADGLKPGLIPEIEILPWRRTNLVGIEVYPSPNRPHFFRDCAFVRVGSSNRRADSELIEEMRRSARHKAFDEEAMPALNSEAIDFRAASELFAPVRPLKRSDLESLSLVTKHNRRDVPTRGGLILFGYDRYRQQYFPDSWIQAGLFGGKDRREILDNAEFRGFPVRAIDESLAFIKRNTSQAILISGTRHVARAAVPELAIREAVINSVVHADYSQTGAPIRVSIFTDRIEIENPGLLPFGLALDEVRKGISKIRNRVIARVFHELGLIEQWGSGIQRMTAACVDAGLAEPFFEEIATRFRVTIYTEKSAQPKLDDVESRILDALGERDGLATAQIAKILELSTRATRSRLAVLLQKGLIVEIGTGPTDPKRRYFMGKP